MTATAPRTPSRYVKRPRVGDILVGNGPETVTRVYGNGEHITVTDRLGRSWDRHRAPEGWYLRSVTPPAPQYVPSHCHGLGDLAGYDVVATSWTPGDTDLTDLVATVTHVIRGANRYAEALELARSHRRGPGTYGYVSHRYTDGCRELGSLRHVRLVDYAEPAARCSVCGAPVDEDGCVLELSHGDESPQVSPIVREAAARRDLGAGPGHWSSCTPDCDSPNCRTL